MDGKSHDNLVWSYEDPYPEVAELKDYLSFYTDRTSITTSYVPGAATAELRVYFLVQANSVRAADRRTRLADSTPEATSP